MLWCILILIVAILFYVFVMMRKSVIPNPPGPTPPPVPPEPEPPDPTFYKWQLVNKTTNRWKEYVAGMLYINRDTLMALEMKKTVDGKKFYVWTAEEGDYWDLPDEVYEKGKVDCDGFARLTSDGLGRFAKYPEVWWMEYYGLYRVYVYDPETGEYSYKVKLGGHAITAYMKDEEILAFSNTSWWHDKNFEDFLDVGEETFPEGLVRVVCRHWETGKAQWIQTAKAGEILEASNTFNRKIAKLKDIKHLDKWSGI